MPPKSCLVGVMGFVESEKISLGGRSENRAFGRGVVGVFASPTLSMESTSCPTGLRLTGRKAEAVAMSSVASAAEDGTTARW